MAGKLYDEKSIESLSPLEFTRLRPGVYVGSTEYSTQLAIEILSNAIDEHKSGHGNRIDVSINKNNAIRIKDWGQGFLVNSFREDGKTILEAAFSVLNTSGKYSDDGVYEGTALGLNGIGSKLATFLSHWLDVYTYRDGQMEHIHFNEGVFESREVTNSKEDSGTIVEWLPSEEFFNNVEIDYSEFKKLLRVLSCLCPGLIINLNIKGEKTTYQSKSGLNDLVDEAVKGKEILKNRFNFNMENGKYKMDMVFTYTMNYSSTIVPYVNTGLTDSGPHITQIKTLLTRELNKFFREKGWLKEKDENLSGDDCQEGLYMAFNITAPGVSYDAQTKSRIVKIDMKPFTQILAEEIQIWLSRNEKEVKEIADKALNARKAREAAKKAREAARAGTTKKNNKFLDGPSKLVDCHGKDRTKCELYITEGDSAMGGLVEARDSAYQAIMPIRGKILSVRKASADKILGNQEIMNIIKALGLEFDTKRIKVIYDRNKLCYSRIYLGTDADPDGSNIKNLLLTMFWTLCPELVENGHIYAAIPPLFRVTDKKNSYIYLRDAKSLEEYKSKHSGEKFQINRMKGLGEMDRDELSAALLEPETRNVQQITVEDSEKAEKMLEMMMGTKVEERKKYLIEHSVEARD